MSTWGLYVHIPWCAAQCPYCGFYTELEGADAPFGRFVGAAGRELEHRAAIFEGQADTVFLGGGTPSRLPGPELARLLEVLPRTPEAEVSAEANPEDLEGPWLDQALSAGINRISLGVQTFDPGHARRLGRAHLVAQAAAAATRLEAAGLRSWSMDLMFALPGQTRADLDHDIDRVIDSGAPHVALYGLTIEPGTGFATLRDRGRLVETDPDLWRTFYDLIVDRLEQAGLARYEVSNFARPGHRCRHNSGTWEGRPYLGLGPSAHSFAPDGRRWINVADVKAWMRDPIATATEERPDPRQAATDRLISALRGVEGCDLERLSARTRLRPAPAAIADLVRAGLLESHGPRIRLTRAGFPVADGVTAALVRTLEQVPAPGGPPLGAR